MYFLLFSAKETCVHHNIYQDICQINLSIIVFKYGNAIQGLWGKWCKLLHFIIMSLHSNRSHLGILSIRWFEETLLNGMDVSMQAIEPSCLSFPTVTDILKHLPFSGLWVEFYLSSFAHSTGALRVLSQRKTGDNEGNSHQCACGSIPIMSILIILG